MINTNRVSVIIPTYKCKDFILDVIKKIPSCVEGIYVVDDCCPDQTGEYVKSECKDKRVTVVKTTKNKGVGGAVLLGYINAKKDGYTIAVKIDGDGQHNPELIQKFISPIESNIADYTKGNRFFSIRNLKKMPLKRVLGNTVLSFLSKASSGYWNCFDPTNGYTALNLKLIDYIDLDKINQRYFFESDLLFQLGLIHAKVIDIPMVALYGDETSNLNEYKIILPFFYYHSKNFIKRIFINYFFRDFNIASVSLIIGSLLFTFGMIFGLYKWSNSIIHNELSSSGAVMLSALPLIFGFQLLLLFLSVDINSVPKDSISSTLQDKNS